MNLPTSQRPIQRSALPPVALALLLAVGCSSTQTRAPQPLPRPGDTPSLPSARPKPPPELEIPPTEILVRQVAREARSLLTRPYRYGGNKPSGFDCSGFTEYVFASVGIDLPRTTVQQAAVGHWVAADELRIGDLVFFGANRSKPFHVGLVVSDPGQPLTMIHASTSRGVIETEILSNSYWLPRLIFGRRAID